MVGLLVALEGIGSHVFIAGQDRSVLRYYFHEERPGVLLWTTYLLCVLTIIPLVLVVLGGSFIADSLAGIPFYPHLLILLGAILFLNFNKIYLSVLRVEELPGNYVAVRISFALLKMLLILGIVFRTGGSVAYMVGVMVAAVVIFLSTLPGIWKRVVMVFDGPLLKRLWGFGWPFMFHVMGGNLLVFADRFMLEWYLDLTIVGSYTLAYTLGGAVVFIYAAMSIYFEPQIYKKAENTEATEQLMGLYSTACIFFGALWGCGILVALPYLVEHVWGEGYASILILVPIILAAHLLMPIYLQANYRLTLHEKTRVLATGTVIAAVANILLNIVLIPALEAEGAAIATFVSLIILCAIVFSLSIKFTGVPWKALTSIPILSGTIIGTTLLVFIQAQALSLIIFSGLAAGTGMILLNSSPHLVAYFKK